MPEYTKESLIAELLSISKRGWVPSCKAPGNDGAVGNTLEVLLGVDENNLPLPDAGDWELKGLRRPKTAKGQGSLLTLFHTEPSPREAGVVAEILLPKYSWPLADHPNEWSFRQTIFSAAPSDRGFSVVVNDSAQRVEISFDSGAVAVRHEAWLESVRQRAGGLGEIDPQPYWTFADLRAKASAKLENTCLVLASARTQNGVEYFHYNGVHLLQRFDFEAFLNLLRQGLLYVDFDARTGSDRSGHNHGTKFRLRRSVFLNLFDSNTVVLEAPPV